MEFLPFVRMQDRMRLDRGDSDTALFLSLMYAGELLIKSLAAFFVAGLDDDRDRHRYRIVHTLVRADGIGEWKTALEDIFTGTAGQFLATDARQLRDTLTSRQAATSWQYRAVAGIVSCLRELSANGVMLQDKVSFLHWLQGFVELRNKTRGHGAVRPGNLAKICGFLELAVSLPMENLACFARPWAHLRRTLSGRHRISMMAGDKGGFNSVGQRPDSVSEDGVYVSIDRPRYVELMHSDADLMDFWFPNGGFTDKKHEWLSYLTGSTMQRDSTRYLAPANQLPPSETDGRGDLSFYANCFGNLPDLKPGYVQRTELERQLQTQMMLDTHPIISLSGPGGIGKTSLALRVLHAFTRDPQCRFSMILWFSARDIDLLPEGPKIVRPKGITLDDFATEFVRLVNPSIHGDRAVRARDYFARQMASSEFGSILFVFDNFETVRNPAEVFAWIDQYIRPPNKVLITTRIRSEFRADFPLEVRGMSEQECVELIDRTADALGIRHLLTNQYRQEVIEESDGHPYVIKILLGEVAKQRTAKRVERIVASRDEILSALFERTYAALSPATQRVFLTVASWRSLIPQIALEAVILRPENERIDVRAAVEELAQTSLIEVLRTSTDGAEFISVPLAAGLFGRKKLAASPWKVLVDADMEILQAFGATQAVHVGQGLAPRVHRLFQSVAKAIAAGEQRLDAVRPVLEYIAGGYPPGWLLLADLYREMDAESYAEQEKICLRRYLEKPSGPVDGVWRRLARICARDSDTLGELHALAEGCGALDATRDSISDAANRINSIFGRGTGPLPHDERKILIQKVAECLAKYGRELTADDCSRLSWLYIRLGDEKKAAKVAIQGLERDERNPHCRRIVERLAPDELWRWPQW